MKTKSRLLVIAVVLALFAATGHLGIVQAVKMAQYVQVIDVRSGCTVNYLPEPDKFAAYDKEGGVIFVGGQSAAVAHMLHCR